MINISIVIPHKNSLHLLERLLASMPQLEDIQIVVVDNSEVRIPKNSFEGMGCVEILYSDPKLGAGHARNVGLNSAVGKWIVFADADDFFLPEAFDTLQRFHNSAADVIYFQSKSTHSDSGVVANRADNYNDLVNDYLENKTKHHEMKLRLMHFVPWGKMIAKDLIDRHTIRFDEVPASNDMMFSTLTGYFATKVDASYDYLYNVTVTKGSLTSSYDQNRNRSRFSVAVRYNAFLQHRGLSKYQISLIIYLKRAAKYGLRELIEFRRIYKTHGLGGLWNILYVWLENRFVSKR